MKKFTRPGYACEAVREEMAYELLGVPGRLYPLIRHAKDQPDQRIRSQKWVSERRRVPKTKAKQWLVVTIRHDDELMNGHATFAITADHKDEAGWLGSGCLHGLIEKTFPELAGLIKWHLCSTDGPLHYVSNTVYQAGDRDHNGLRYGEERQLCNGKTGKLSWKLEATADLPKYVDSDTCPNETALQRYVPWIIVGDGKARDLDAARSSAIWPDATDEQLTVEPAELRKSLEARLDGLLAEFRQAIEEAGLEFV